MNLHPKIKELQALGSKPINFGNFNNLTDANIRSKLIVRADEQNPRKIKGYLCIWNVVDSYRTLWIRGCFAKSIRERGPKSNASQKIVLLWQHRLDEPIGQFEVLVEDEIGLYFEAIIDDIPTGNRALTQINSGTINQFSFGFDYLWDKLEYMEELDAIKVLEADLFEGSAVTIASIKETYAIRSKQDFDAAILDAKSHLDEALRDVPRSKQLNLRQALTEYLTLLEIKPNFVTRQKALKKKQPASNLEINKIKFV